MKERITGPVRQRIVSRREFTEDQDRARRLEVRVDELEHRAAAAEEAFTRLAEQIDGLGDHLPFLLDRLGTSNASDREFARRLSALEQRTEFIRREILHEFRHGDAAEQPLRNIADDVEPAGPAVEIPHDGPVRLNLGAGHHPIDGFVNVDARELPGIDVVADVAALPFRPGSIQAIHSAHLLEHFPQERLRRRLLPHFRDLLVPGGEFSAVVPDAEAMLRAHAQDEQAFSFDRLRLVTFGEQEYDGDYHHTMFTPSSLTALLEEAGFVDVAVPVCGRLNGECFEFEITAKTAREV